MPPPQGISEFDFETIEAAVTETVRGRWFLNEFARRARSAEGKATLDAILRLEALVTLGQTALPSPAADPSVRLLIQRIKDIAAQLDGVSLEMRQGGVADDLCDAVNGQARALAGLMRGGSGAPSSDPRSHQARMMPTSAPLDSSTRAIATVKPAVDPRLAILSRLDGLPLAKKLALFA